MPIWDVLLTRTEQAHINVEADTKEQARDDAEQLVDEKDWVEVDADSEVMSEVVVPSERYWSGGPEGRWVQP